MSDIYVVTGKDAWDSLEAEEGTSLQTDRDLEPKVLGQQRKLDAYQRDQLREDFSSGMSKRSLGKKYGIATKTVRAYLK